MAIGAFRIGLMCCVVAGKREDQQMEEMRIRIQKQGEPKTDPVPRYGRDRAVLPFAMAKPSDAGRGRNERDWALPLCG